MDYTSWKFNLLPTQIGRMHRNSHFLSCRKYIYNTFPEDVNHDHTGEGQLHPLEITRNETWDFDIRMFNDIIIKTGNKLTIKCRVHMPYHSNIIVEPGAELIIDNGLITSHNDETMWYGISVLGNRNLPQDVAGNQGVITMKNGATISNALHAINLSDAVWNDYNKTGGIANISDAHFINNRHSIGWDSYHNLSWKWSGTAWTKTWLRPNLSGVVRSTFEVNNQMIRNPYYQISMFDVDNITISGCQFEYKLPFGTFTGDADNIAIYSVGSSLNVKNWSPAIGSGTPVQSTFKGFPTGILSKSFASAGFLYAADAAFENNQIGILTSAINSFKVKGNNFKMHNPIYAPFASVGVKINSSTGYNVFNNNFTNAGYPIAPLMGVVVENGGSDNLVIRNNTYSYLGVGNYSLGSNTNGVFDHLFDIKSKGLQFLCNTYGAAIVESAEYVDAEPTMTNRGMRSVQGEAGAPAGNTFLADPASGYHIEQQYVGTSTTTPKTNSIEKYYYSTFDPAEEPIVYTPNVTPVALSIVKKCDVADESGTGGSTTGGSSTSVATAASIALIAAYNDYSEARPSLLRSALLAMNSPYAQTELAILEMQEGDVAKGLGIYQAIIDTMALSADEQSEFALGASLIRIIAAHYQSNVLRWDSLTPMQIDTLRHIRNTGKMWAKERACNWLGYALNEYCPILLPNMPGGNDSNNIGNTMRKTAPSVANAVANYLHISPNPSDKDFAINYNSTQDATLIISDIVGRKILNVVLPAQQHQYTINARNWVNGVYLYQVLQGNKVLYYGKLLKQ